MWCISEYACSLFSLDFFLVFLDFFSFCFHFLSNNLVIVIVGEVHTGKKHLYTFENTRNIAACYKPGLTNHIDDSGTGSARHKCLIYVGKSALQKLLKEN